MTLIQLYNYLESVLPPLEIEGIDSDGIQVLPDPDREVKKILIALDPYEEEIDRAIKGRYDLLLTHHPLFWGEPMPNTPPERWYNKLMEANVASFSFHIRLDRAKGGVNDILAGMLKLQNVESFDDPEIPGIGRVGDLKEEMTVSELARLVKRRLRAPSVAYTALRDGRPVKRVAVLGGSASDAIASAAAAGADVLVGGEFKHHSYGYASVEGNGRGIALIEAGHYHTEEPVCMRLKELVHEAMPDAMICVLHCNRTYIK